MRDKRTLWMILMLLAGARLALAQDAGAGKTALEVKASGLKTFYIDNQAGSNQVTFVNEAPIEDFTGVCNKVQGQCKLDPKALESFTGKFSIRVQDMKTGIDLRDTHLNSEDWLDSTKNPEVIVDVTKVEDVKKTGANTATMTLVGNCSLHGKTNPVKIPATLTYLDETPKTQERIKGDLLRIRAEFNVKLADYDITGPKASQIVGLKVANDIAVKASVYGSTEPPPKGLEADKPVDSGKKQPAPPQRP